ncbi:hypothetical protein [Pseudomonas sp. SDO558_S425]
MAVSATNCLSVAVCQKDDFTTCFDDGLHLHYHLTLNGTLEMLSGDGCRSFLTLITLTITLYSSLALNHELPSLSMPPAYKEERTEPALCRFSSGALTLKHSSYFPELASQVKAARKKIIERRSRRGGCLSRVISPGDIVVLFVLVFLQIAKNKISCFDFLY